MAVRNKYKNAPQDEYEIEKPEPPKKKAEPASFNPVGNTWNFLRDERTHKVTGLFLVMSALYLFVAFISFLFTWRQDQSLVLDDTMTVMWNADPQDAGNWMGVLGAVLANLFIYKWFGVASFCFPLLFFLSGVRIWFGVTLLPLGKTFRYCFWGLLWLSPMLGLIFSGTYPVLGGAFGFHVSRWLSGLAGIPGAALILLFYLMTFLFVVFNLNIRWPAKAPASSAPKPVPPADKITEPAPKTVAESSPLMQAETEIPLTEEEELSAEDFEISVLQKIMEEDTTPLSEEEELAEQQPHITMAPVAMEEPPAETILLSSEGDVQFKVERTREEEQVEEVRQRIIEAQGPFDPTLDLPGYQLPTLDLLKDYQVKAGEIDARELEENKKLIVETLKNYNIQIAEIKATIGPTVTLYEIIPAPGIRIAKIKNLEDDIALSLAALGIRIIAPIPGKGTIGIEVPNKKPEMVPLRGILASAKFQHSDFDLPVAFGKTITNEVYMADLSKMPHLLIAGSTGQGKSVGLNVILVSLLYKKHPSQIKFVLVDPKKVELTLFKTIERHFLAKLPGDGDAIITDTKKVIHTLNSLCMEMDQRYDLLKDAHCRNIKEYNQKFVERSLNPENGHRYLPYIVLVIDELADLMMTAGKEVETPIARLAQLARAIGIHLVVATQRPSVNVITGIIKANFPARLAFRTIQKIDSRTILDAGGAEQLIGKGDMLIGTGGELIRVQCAFVDTPEVEAITEYIGTQRGYSGAYQLPEVKEEQGEGSVDMDLDERDSMFDEAARVIVTHQQGSTSLLQRKLKLGYNRAGRLIDQLEHAGIVGPFEGSKAREVLIQDLYTLEQHLKNLNENQS